MVHYIAYIPIIYNKSHTIKKISEDACGHFSAPPAQSATMSVRKTRQPLVSKDKPRPTFPFSTWDCFTLMGFLGAQASDAKQGQLIFNRSWLVPGTHGSTTGFNSNQEDGPIWSRRATVGSHVCIYEKNWVNVIGWQIPDIFNPELCVEYWREWPIYRMNLPSWFQIPNPKQWGLFCM